MAITKITTEVIADGAITSAKLGSGSVSASSLTGITTDNVSEGSTNVYHTAARARGSVSVTGGGISYDSGTGVIQIASIPNASLANSSLTVNSNSVSLGGTVTLDTDDIGEGSTNLYFTNARAQAAISGGTGVTVSGGTISIGQDVATSSTPTFGNITTTGYIAGPATFTIDPAAVGDNTGTVVIAGNLQVDGTTTTINSTTLTVDDLNIVLASGAANAAAASGAGITVDGASATITYNATNDEWDFNKNINVTGIKDINTIDSSGSLTLTVDDADFIIADSTDTPANFIWRDHDVSKLYLGTSSAVATLRSTLDLNSNNITNAGTISSGAITATAPIKVLQPSSSSINELLVLEADDPNADIIMTDNSGSVRLRTASNGDFVVFTGGSATSQNASGASTALTIDENQNSTFSGSITGTKADFTTSSTTDYVLRLTDSGVADYDVIFPDTSTYQLTTNTTSNKTFKLLNSGTGTFNLEAEGTALVENAKLKAIDTSNSDTAVDVFVYDTRKDSDGGAWRHRTQHTSWYNETLNTSTRGSRKEFPSVAVIVAESTQVTIYDGDDPDMPMWMVFNQGAYYYLPPSRIMTCLSALNGYVMMGFDQSVAGILLVDFIGERSRVYSSSSSEYRDWTKLVADRNIGGGYATNSSYAIVNDQVNDVAMKVLPNAPINSATGLPAPTIAVATDGGVSVIKDNGTIVDITAGAGSSYNGVSWIDITENNYLIFEQDNASRSVFHIPIPSADRTSETNDGSITDKVILKFYTNGAHLPYPVFNGSGVIDGIGLEGNNQALRGSGNELTLLEPNLENPEHGKVAYITSEYNTGWMYGDIKLATLADTNAANNYEYVEGYGDFTTGSAWTVDTGWSTSGNVATKTGGTGNNYISKSIGTAFTPDKWYQAEFDLLSGSGTSVMLVNRHRSGVVKPYSGGATNVDVEFFQPYAGSSKYYAIWKQSNINTGSISLYSGSSVSLDNFKVYEINAHDRSANTNHLLRIGSVTKSAVATGAELMAYSGFSNTDYLQQPNNSDLNFGTGSYSIMGWIKTDTTTSTGMVAQLGPSDTDESLCVYVQPTSYGIYFDYGGGAQYAYLGNTTDRSTISDTRWHHFVCHLSAGSYPKIYVDGVEKAITVVNTAPSTLTFDTDYVLNIGNGRGTTPNLPFGGSIALIRISKTVPTAEEISKIYEDEKFLFQENSKATLYGSADSVVALAHDDTTKLLHIGTSAGRSVFHRLSRVDNTTDAITVAISASNELVVEE